MIFQDDIIFFVGPTISKKEIDSKIEAKVLGPASQGDILKAHLRFKPKCMAIIDGFYENMPAVWHKEILFVMSQGVHVFGAASMGALRAAELSAFGMNGIGKIYEMYLSGEIEDDDEVAILHGPEQLGFPAITDAMINIRLTLKQALEENIISLPMFDAGINFIKKKFYKNRKLDSLANYFEEAFLLERKVFLEWTKEKYIDQKKIDAWQLIESINTKKDKFTIPKTVNFKFFETSHFRRMKEYTQTTLL